jgi:hypothetical protein
MGCVSMISPPVPSLRIVWSAVAGQDSAFALARITRHYALVAHGLLFRERLNLSVWHGGIYLPSTFAPAIARDAGKVFPGSRSLIRDAHKVLALPLAHCSFHVRNLGICSFRPSHSCLTVIVSP